MSATTSMADPRGPIPRGLIQLISTPFERFLRIQAASGVFLLVCTVIALSLANSPWSGAFAALWDTRLRVALGGFALDYSLRHWVNDGLMTFFFFVIGLEIKQELVAGELRDRSKVFLPIASAVGGALVPVSVFLLFQFGQEGQAGWAVPMATDIAFVVGALAMFGSRIPGSLKVFLLTLAIVDDILAVLVIALFYTNQISLAPAVAALVGIGVVALLNRIGVRTVGVYLLVGAVVWLFALESGIHPTVAGVLLGLITPSAAWVGADSILEVLARSSECLRVPSSDSGCEEQSEQLSRSSVLSALHFASREAVSPLERLETALHPWVAFAIMPIFALANAGIEIDSRVLFTPVSIAVAASLVLGKPVGILLTAGLVTRVGWGALPSGVSWIMLTGGGCLAGVGFTMSLFVASLGLKGSELMAAKGGVLIGSTTSLVLGMSILYLCFKSETR